MTLELALYSIMLSVLAHEMVSLQPWLARKIMRIAAWIDADQPDEVEDIYAEYIAGSRTLPGSFSALVMACGLLFKVAIARRGHNGALAVWCTLRVRAGLVRAAIARRRAAIAAAPRVAVEAPSSATEVKHEYYNVHSAQLLTSLFVLLAVLGCGTAFLIPTEKVTATECIGAVSGLQVRVAYPLFISSGDEETLRVTLTNHGTFDVEDGFVVVDFPVDAFDAAGRNVSIPSDNAMEFDQLKPGEQQSLAVAFTYTQGGLLPGFHSSLPAEIVVSAANSTCPIESQSLTVAPIPYLRNLQKAALGLVAAVLFPLMVEWTLKHCGRRRTPSTGDQRPAKPDATLAGG